MLFDALSFVRRKLSEPIRDERGEWNRRGASRCIHGSVSLTFMHSRNFNSAR